MVLNLFSGTFPSIKCNYKWINSMIFVTDFSLTYKNNKILVGKDASDTDPNNRFGLDPNPLPSGFIRNASIVVRKRFDSESK